MKTINEYIIMPSEYGYSIYSNRTRISSLATLDEAIEWRDTYYEGDRAGYYPCDTSADYAERVKESIKLKNWLGKTF